MVPGRTKGLLSLLIPVLTMALASPAPGQTLLRGTKPQHPVTGGSKTAAKKRKSTATIQRPVSVGKAGAKSRKTNPAVTSSKATISQDGMTFAEAVALQASLDRAGYSPGIIDGLIGRKTIAAIRAFQKSRGLPVTGMADSATRLALGVDATPATTPYRLTAQDQAQVGECPTDWIEKSKAQKLGYESMTSVAAFRGHCTRALVERLNVGKNLAALKAGDVVVIPNVEQTASLPPAASIEVDFAEKTVKAFDASNRLVGLFHCSIAKETRHRPAGNCKVATISMNPIYTFKPESWPEVKGINRNLEIPPGPRNPVGLCWIGLDKKGYGIHGTPEPELIGKTGSHGCIRLTNWDVLRLAEMVRVGTSVRFIDSGAAGFASAR